ncbi:hydroxyethylthiazole kinase [Alkaliphilus pronyensis]|uniref:Hydroxyethylthiazole kinase n=1 Tax=Alkaliphilus pronyensis TaxID=1482732 RepID=A0A6I0F8J1_9FIRM|nr:hydroxyethylthiazole kinase [Alkaliphilus pronyensis]KAB3531312.1 hydroxyethylthiazole kinase [Alkaliphilus pronyensis]
MSIMHKEFTSILKKIRMDKPLVHHITNYVTANDCANVVLSLGGAPVMADDPIEVEEMVSIASSLVLNIGTINHNKIEAFIKAGKKANQLGIPVILDPVGVGATSLRSEAIKEILAEVKISVLRGNMSEIKNIYGVKSLTRGVDSSDDTMAGGREIAESLAKTLKCIIAITGKIDIVSDGRKTYYINHGHERLTKITGTGCMTTSLIGLCCGAKESYLYGAILGVVIMAASGEKAYNQLEDIGTYRVKLMDYISRFSIEEIGGGEKIHEAN